MKSTDIPDGQQYKALIDWLKARGLSQSAINTVVGNSPQNRTMGTIAERIRALLRSLPKG